MRPKTRLEKEVFALSNKLPPVSNKAVKWAYKHLFEHYVFISKKRYLCLNCGHEWKPNNKLVCPSCNNTLTALPGKTRTSKADAYLVVITTYKGWQVFRFVYMKKESNTNNPLSVEYHEVYQHWFNTDGKHIIMAVPTYCFGFSRYSYYDPWSFGTLSIKTDDNKFYGWNGSSDNRYQIAYPYYKLLPELKRNGYDVNIIKSSKIHYVFAAELLLNDHIAETLIKAKEYDLFNYIGNGSTDIRNYWQQIKICLRHKYKIDDVSIWIDHIRLLRNEGIDINNPKYICPDNLRREHQKLVNKIQRRREVENRRLIKERDEKDKQLRLKYKDHVKPFRNLVIRNDDIMIKPILSVRDMKKEGEILDHCVYESKYYTRHESLLLSARKDDKRIATIEFSLKNMSIAQCRGMSNDVPNDYDNIVSLINNNIKIIKKCLKRKELLSA
jgi:hypothetical protein